MSVESRWILIGARKLDRERYTSVSPLSTICLISGRFSWFLALLTCAASDEGNPVNIAPRVLMSAKDNKLGAPQHRQEPGILGDVP